MPHEQRPRLLPVADALDSLLSPLSPTSTETIAVTDSVGRVLAQDAVSRLDLPPAAVSAMDGYAIRAADGATSGASVTRIGESAAGHPFTGTLGPGEAVRIFTGAIVPDGADSIILQEDVTASGEQDGATITLNSPAIAGKFIRPAGLDATVGSALLPAGTLITARGMALLLASGHTQITVQARPHIGILSTGDELVRPGDDLAPGQIISSNAAYLAAFVTACGGIPVDLGIAADRAGAALAAVRATPLPLDFIVTTGGASVGTHDHIATDLESTDAKSPSGTALSFWKIAMRPGKPLISGAIDGIPLLGLPGNPVSSAICALVFLRPAMARMTGTTTALTSCPAELATDLADNDHRQDYLRVTVTYRDGHPPLVTPAPKQDSSMISVLARCNALAVRPPFDPARKAGDTITILPYPDGL